MDKTNNISKNTDVMKLLEGCPETFQKLPGNMIAFEQTDLAELPVDPALVKQAIDGDEEAFNELFMQTYRHVFMVVRYYLTNDDDIREVIQDTYTKVYANLYRLKTPEAFYSWLRHIAKNCAIDYLEHQEPSKASLSQWEMSSSFADILAEEDERLDVQLDITSILKEIPEEQANLLVMIYYDGMSVSEIARALDMPFSTVYSRVRAAKKRLKQQLKAKGIDKPMYGGGFVAMISNSLRYAVGTQLLSVTVAEEIFQSVVKKGGKADTVVAKATKQQRNQAILRIASVLVAVSIGTSCLTVFLIQNGNKLPKLFTVVKMTETQSDYAASSENTSVLSQVSSGVAPASSATASAQTEASSKVETLSSQASVMSVDSFQPDYQSGQKNTVGRNANSYTITTQGDWIYYSEGNNHCYLMKMKKDGTERQRLTESNQQIWHINVIGDWIYYVNVSGVDLGIWKIRTDGSKKEQLTTEYIDNFYVVGKYGYFTATTGYGNGRALYQIDLETKKTAPLVNFESSVNMLALEDTIFCTTNGDLYAYDLKSKEINLLRADTGLPMIYQDDLYFYVTGGLERAGYTGGKLVTKEMITLATVDKGEGTRNGSFNFISPYKGGSVLSYYYIANNNGDPISDCYHFVQTFSSEIIEWPEEVSQSAWEIQPYFPIGDDYVYAYNTDMRLVRVQMDGTGYQVIS